METKCKNCKYRENKVCHLYPPIVIADNPSFTSARYEYPTVDGNDWCGLIVVKE